MISHDPNVCRHFDSHQVWVEKTYENLLGEEYDDSEWEWQETSYLHDIDLHRMQCSYCGKIEYYSNRAREHFEGEAQHQDIENSNKRYLERKNK